MLVIIIYISLLLPEINVNQILFCNYTRKLQHHQVRTCTYPGTISPPIHGQLWKSDVSTLGKIQKHLITVRLELITLKDFTWICFYRGAAMGIESWRHGTASNRDNTDITIWYGKAYNPTCEEVFWDIPEKIQSFHFLNTEE